MKTLHRATLLAAALSIAACAIPPKTDDRLILTPATFKDDYDADLCVDATKCEVVVTVAKDCKMQPKPFIIGISKDLGAVDITWKISSNSYGNTLAFPNDGITIKNSSNEFSDPRPAGKVFKLKDKNPHDGGNPRREYAYTIKVTQGSRTCKLDPTVINDY